MMRVLSPTYEIRITIKDPYVSPHYNTQSMAAGGAMDMSNGHKYFDSFFFLLTLQNPRRKPDSMNTLLKRPVRDTRKRRMPRSIRPHRIVIA
jgi:hypothetical protein